MFTHENILNQEAWCAFALAIISPEFLVPDQACAILAKGKCIRRNWDAIAPEMIAMREQGFSWSDIAEAFSYSVGSAKTVVSKWKNRQEKSLGKPRPMQRKDITDEDLAHMVQLKETMTYQQIGDMYGMRADAVYTRIRRFKGII